MHTLRDFIFFAILAYFIARALLKFAYGAILMIIGVFLLVVGYTISFSIWIYEQIKMAFPRYKRQQFLHYLASCLTSSRG